MATNEEENQKIEREAEVEEQEQEENNEYGEEMKEDNVKSDNQKKKKKKSKKKKKPTAGNNNQSKFSELRDYLIKESNDSGRCAIAKENIHKGRCILREQAYQVMSRGKLCLKCGKILLDDNGSGSGSGSEEVEGKSPFCYCSSECQNILENEYVSRMKEKLSTIREISILHDCSEDLIIISLLIFFAQRLNISQELDTLFEVKSNFVLSTHFGCQNQVSHLSEQQSDWIVALRGAFETILFDSFSSTFNRERDLQVIDVVVEIAAQVNSNSYGIFDRSINKSLLGFGVFPVAAMTINHSCRPNLINVFVNGVMEFRTTRPIQKNEELSVSYINCLQGFTKRREELLNSRFFCCACARCRLHENALLNSINITNLTTDLISDLMLDGLHCTTCGPSGVVILSLTTPPQCYCIQCRNQFSDIESAKMAISVAYSSWETLSKTLPPHPQQGLLNLEKWLIEFDPLFSEPVNNFPLQQLLRIKQSHSIQFQLHSHHSLLITAHQVYLNLLENHLEGVSAAAGGAGGGGAMSQSLKSLQRYQRVYEMIKHVCPEQTIERIEFENIYFKKLNEVLTSHTGNSVTKKSLQAYRKQHQEISQQLNEFRETLTLQDGINCLSG